MTARHMRARICPACLGVGAVVTPITGLNVGLTMQVWPCEVCGGDGKVDDPEPDDDDEPLGRTDERP